MEVLEYGKIKPRIFACPYCGAKLSVLDSDMVFTGISTLQPGFTRYKETYSFSCAVCGRTIDRDENKGYIFLQEKSSYGS